MTSKQLAQAYAETIKGPANGWGQCVHPTLGRSDYIMWRLRNMVGRDECERLITEAMKRPEQCPRCAVLSEPGQAEWPDCKCYFND